MRVDGGLWVPGAISPPDPSAGYLLYPKSDGMWYTKDSSGTEILIGSKQIPEPDTSTDAVNKNYVDTAIARIGTLGQEMGYAERTSDFTTTNTTLYSSTLGIVTSLSVTVTGTGRPAEIAFYSPSVGHSAGTSIVTSWLLSTTSGVTDMIEYKNWAVNSGEGGLMSARRILTAGTSYAFTVGVAGNVAGTTTLYAGSTHPTYLVITQR